MAGAYDIGDRPRCKAEFKIDNVLTDPTSIIFKYKNPSGTLTILTYGVDSELVKESTGIYYVDLDVDQSGQYFYRFEGTGAVKAAGDSKFTIKQNEF